MAKLLIITHDELLAKAYVAHLSRREGFSVEHRPTAQSGLRHARVWKPELILLDLTLPGLHGLDVLKWLSDVPRLVKIPVVLLVERTMQPEVLAECRRWGIHSTLDKDTCSLERLVAHLHDVLEPASST